MNGIGLLREDHERISSLFSRLERCPDPSEREQLFDELKQLLNHHTIIEDDVLLSPLSENPNFEDAIVYCTENNNTIRLLLEEVECSLSTSFLQGKLNALIEAVQDHLDQFESDVYGPVEQAMDMAQMDELAAKIETTRSYTPIYTPMMKNKSRKAAKANPELQNQSDQQQAYNAFMSNLPNRPGPFAHDQPAEGGLDQIDEALAHMPEESEKAA